MSKLGDATVYVRANLSPLHSGLALAKATVSSAMRGIGAVVGKAYDYAKKGALAFAAASTYATYAAIKQEDAEFELANALKRSGEYSEEAMKNIMSFASAMQKATTFGDEYVMTLMRMAKSHGLNIEQSKDAAKAAISLYEGYGGGRGKPEIFLRYYIDALQGAGTALGTYIPKLREAKDEEERFKLLQEAVAEGWGVSTDRAKTSGGALKQIKNIISDVAERYGKYLLPVLQRWRDWMDTNKNTMMMWAERVGVSVLFIKDALIDTVKYLQINWFQSLKDALSVVTTLFKAVGNSIYIIFEESFLAVAAAIPEWLGKAAAEADPRSWLAKKLTKIHYAAEYSGKTYNPLKGVMQFIEGYKKSQEYVESLGKAGEYDFSKTSERISNLNKRLTDTWSQALDEMADKVPKELVASYKDSWKELNDALIQIEEKYRSLEAEADIATKAEQLKPKTDEAKKGKLGIVGITDAWRMMVEQITVKDPMLRKIDKSNELLTGINNNTRLSLKSLDEISDTIESVGTVGP